MKLYFYGTNRQENREETSLGMISFAIPDIGFIFRSAHRGTSTECEYQALLMLCLFVEANAELFKGQKLEFLGNSATVVYQVNQTLASAPFPGQTGKSFSDDRKSTSGSQTWLLERILAFKKKLGFSICWVPLLENRAAEQAALHPTLKNFSFAVKLDTSFLEVFRTGRNRESGLSSF